MSTKHRYPSTNATVLALKYQLKRMQIHKYRDLKQIKKNHVKIDLLYHAMLDVLSVGDYDQAKLVDKERTGLINHNFNLQQEVNIRKRHIGKLIKDIYRERQIALNAARGNI